MLPTNCPSCAPSPPRTSTILSFWLITESFRQLSAHEPTQKRPTLPEVRGITHHLRGDDHDGHRSLLAGRRTLGGHRVHAVRGGGSADQRRRRTHHRTDSGRIPGSGTELVL